MNEVEENYLLGTKVICRSNEDEPYTVGTLVNFYIHRSGSKLPVVKPEDSSLSEIVVMGIIVKYSEKWLQLLDTMSNKEQWDFLSGNMKFIKSLSNYRK